MSPWRIPASMGNDGVSPSVGKTVEDVSVYIILIAAIICFGKPLATIFNKLSTGIVAWLYF